MTLTYQTKNRFAILLAKDQLVNMVRPKRHLLQPADLHLIVNFITTSTTFKSSESWTPICLPQFNDKVSGCFHSFIITLILNDSDDRYSTQGYLHAYVYYITPEVCLLLMSSKGDHFYELSGKKDFIEKELRSTGALSAIVMAIERQHYSPSSYPRPFILMISHSHLTVNSRIDDTGVVAFCLQATKHSPAHETSIRGSISHLDRTKAV